MAVRKSAAGFALVALLGLFALVYAVANGGAASANTKTSVKMSPHYVPAGEQGLIVVSFTNNGPSAVNHVLATVGKASTFNANGDVTGVSPLPFPASAFTTPPNSLPSGCSAVAVNSLTSYLVCDFGQVKKPGVRRVVSFTAPEEVPAFRAGVKTTFDESKGSQNTDTVFGGDAYSFSSIAGEGVAADGSCTPGAANQLTASNGDQETAANAPQLPSPFPCTPLTVGVDSVKQPNNVPDPWGDISFVDFLSEAGLATVTVSFFEGVPPGVNRNNATFYELPQFPNSLAATNGGAAIPACVKVQGKFQIPITEPEQFTSCVLGTPSNIPGGGLAVTFLVQGGEDGGFGGI